LDHPPNENGKFLEDDTKEEDNEAEDKSDEKPLIPIVITKWGCRACNVTGNYYKIMI